MSTLEYLTFKRLLEIAIEKSANRTFSYITEDLIKNEIIGKFLDYRTSKPFTEMKGVLQFIDRKLRDYGDCESVIVSKVYTTPLPEFEVRNAYCLACCKPFLDANVCRIKYTCATCDTAFCNYCLNVDEHRSHSFNNCNYCTNWVRDTDNEVTINEKLQNDMRNDWMTTLRLDAGGLAAGGLAAGVLAAGGGMIVLVSTNYIIHYL